MDRKDVGSWISGPPSAVDSATTPGERLGLPPSGPGSVAGYGRRVAALFVDWWIGLGMTWLFFPHLDRQGVDYALAVPALAGLEIWVLTATLQASFGQYVLRLRVASLRAQRVGVVEALLRTFLLLLVVPPLVTDRDRRGLHDRAAGTVVVRAG